jgi:hypothetical protein
MSSLKLSGEWRAFGWRQRACPVWDWRARNGNAPVGARPRWYFCLRAERCNAGVNNRLDLFGVLILSFTAGNAGGIARDLVLGAVPPAAISDWHYLAVSLLAGIVTFWRPSIVDRLRSPVPLNVPVPRLSTGTLNPDPPTSLYSIELHFLRGEQNRQRELIRCWRTIGCGSREAP